MLRSGVVQMVCWLVCMASGALWACAPAPESSSINRPNLPPEAALRTPVIAPVGQPIHLDASDSFDPDADPLTYIFAVGGVDAIHSADPVVSYTFPSDGLYTVSVRVIDLHGAEAVAKQDVTAIINYPDPPDFCDAASPCVVGNECDHGVCYSTGGSLD